MDSLQAGVAVVLVRARNPLNIGAAARAMSNFGFADLRIVSDYDVPLANTRSAVNAVHLLHSARQFRSVAEAVAGCSLVYGTTALGDRRLEHPVDVLRDAADRIRNQRQGGEAPSAAVLFGSEKTGLSNEEMSHCHRLLTIPMQKNGVSMNLGQAVGVCLYELVRASAAQRALPETSPPATSEQLARMQALLQQVLHAAEYDRRFPGNVDEQALRQLVLRTGMTADDTAIWMGMLRQMLWKLRGGKPVPGDAGG